MWQRLPATLSLAIREKLPEASLSDEDIREMTETIRTFRESMQSLREVERTPENADRVRELMGRVEEDRRQFEKTTGMSIAEFVQRTTTSGIDNGKPEEGKGIPETLDGPGR
jgi:transcriptional regulator with AAA-type ATPase domain